MTGTFGCRAFMPTNKSRGRRDDPPLELRWRQASGPAIEQLHRLRAGLDLRGKILERHLLDAADDLGKSTWIGIGQSPRFGLVAAALPRDHVGRDGPRAPCEADQSLGRIELGFDLAHRLVNRFETSEEWHQMVERRVDQRRRQARPLTGDEAQILPDCERNDQNVRKEDCSVERRKSA